MNPTIHATTACFPGLSHEPAIQRILDGLREPLVGVISAAHIQICPQTPGAISERVAERLVERYPDVRFRPHANARVLPKHYVFDLSTFSDDTRFYYEALADRARRLGSTAVSLHAGYADQCPTLEAMLDNLARVQDLFGDITVAVEGLYPSRGRTLLVNCWRDYDTLLRRGTPLAIDLSHLNIVATHEGSVASGLLIDLLCAPQTVEIHLSSNDGLTDRHLTLDPEPPFWWPLLQQVQTHAVCFTEGNHLRHPIATQGAAHD